MAGRDRAYALRCGDRGCQGQLRFWASGGIVGQAEDTPIGICADRSKSLIMSTEGLAFGRRIIPFRALNSKTNAPETHFCVWDGDQIVAFCTYESSARAVLADVESRGA